LGNPTNLNLIAHILRSLKRPPRVITVDVLKEKN